MAPASVFDVAHYILRRKGPIAATQLHRLVYYTQAWSLAWHYGLLFDDPIEAWEHGPVVPTLWKDHQDPLLVKHLSRGNANALTTNQSNLVNAVCGHYGTLDSEVLNELTPAEDPWRTAYAHGSSTVIDPYDLMTYYQKIGTTLLHDFDPADVMNPFWLYLLLMQVTPENRPATVDWGMPMGKEAW